MPPEVLDPSLPNSGSLPDWAIYLLLAGWLIDRVLSFIKWQMERASSTDIKSQGHQLHGAAQEVHDMAVIIQTRDNDGKPLVWSSKTPILDELSEARDDLKEVKELVAKNHTCIQAIESKIGVVDCGHRE